MIDFTTTRQKLNFDIRFMTECEHAAMRAFLPTRPGAPAVDLAAGTGRNLQTLLSKGYAVEAVDLDATFLERAAASLPEADRGRIRLSQGDATRWQPSEPVDVVVLSGIMILMLDDAALTALLSNAARMLRPGGLLWTREATAPTYAWSRHGDARLPAAVYRTRPELHRTIAEVTGLTCQHWGYFRRPPATLRRMHSLAGVARLGAVDGAQAVEQLTHRLVSQLGPGPCDSAAEQAERRYVERGEIYRFAWGLFG